MDHKCLVIERFIYNTVHCGKGECKIEASRITDGRVAVIATELVDNPGMSITNAAEYVASDVCEQLGIDPDKLVWIEYYGYPAPGDVTRRRTYDLVTFASITPRQYPWFHEPKWKVMKDEDWHQLNFRPPPQR